MICALPLVSLASPLETAVETAADAKGRVIRVAQYGSFRNVLQKHSPHAITLADKITIPELEQMIVTITIENEKSDSTNYSADVIITWDDDAIIEWLKKNDIEVASTDAGRTSVVMEFDNTADLRTILNTGHETNADVKISRIHGNMVVVNVRSAAHNSFVSAVRGGGVTVSY